MGFHVLQILLIFASSVLTFKTPQLETAYEWKEIEYKFPTTADQQYAETHELFVRGNSALIDVGIDSRNDGSCRTFATVPRFTTGIPASLGVVETGPNGPLLKPYPSYSWHSSHGMNCDGITSVFRIAIDECRRLWVLDTGRIGSVQFCPPQILTFDLETDELTHRYRFPQSQYKTGVSLFITPIVDVRDSPPRGTCKNTFVYIADVTGFGLVVYNFATDSSWRIENKLFYPYPNYGTFTIAGESFDLMDGIFGMSVTPRSNRGERYLYFHALASGTENSVPLRIIDNETIWNEDMEATPRSFTEIGSRKVQSGAEAMDSSGNLFFGLMEPVSIAAWDINRPYRPENIMIVSKDTQKLQFVSGMKIVKNKYNQEELWAVSNRFQKIATGTKSSNEVNFRILGCLVEDLIKNKPCRRIRKCDAVVGSRGSHNDNLIFT